MTIDADAIVLTLGLGALAYGIYSRSTRLAGYETTPPPSVPLEPPPVPTLPEVPGVPLSILKACAAIVDSPGGTLSGPVAPKGMDPDRLRTVVNELVRRLHAADPALEWMATVIDGGSCVGDAEGAEQVVVTWVLYERITNISHQLVSGVISLEDGTYRVTGMDPATPPDSTTTVVSAETLRGSGFKEYALPISPDI